MTMSLGPRSTVTPTPIGSTGAYEATVPDGCRFIAVDTSSGAIALGIINPPSDIGDSECIGVSNAGGTNELTVVPSGNLRTGSKIYHLATAENVVTLIWHAATSKWDTVASGSGPVTTP